MGRSGRVRVGDADLEVDTVGAGEPVVVIQTALDAEELRPLAEQLAQRGATGRFTTTAGATPGAARSTAPDPSQAMPTTAGT